VWMFFIIYIMYCDSGFSKPEVFLTLTEDFSVLFLSCKANARVKLAKTGHGQHSSIVFVLFGCYYLCCSVVICVVRLLFVLFYVLFVCKCVLPPGDDAVAVNKYFMYHIKY
jgi:hypothetical protein